MTPKIEALQERRRVLAQLIGELMLHEPPLVMETVTEFQDWQAMDGEFKVQEPSEMMQEAYRTLALLNFRIAWEHRQHLQAMLDQAKRPN